MSLCIVFVVIIKNLCYVTGGVRIATAKHAGRKKKCAHFASSHGRANIVIKNLFPFLKRYCKEANLANFAGKTAAIDASCWMHRALAISVSGSGNREG